MTLLNMPSAGPGLPHGFRSQHTPPASAAPFWSASASASSASDRSEALTEYSPKRLFQLPLDTRGLKRSAPDELDDSSSSTTMCPDHSSAYHWSLAALLAPRSAHAQQPFPVAPHPPPTTAAAATAPTAAAAAAPPPPPPAAPHPHPPPGALSLAAPPALPAPSSPPPPGQAAGHRPSASPSSVLEPTADCRENERKSRFVYKLYKMVEEADAESFIAWSPSGNSVVISDVEAFTASYLGRHFHHNNFSSLVRQLNMYGFYKTNKALRSFKDKGQPQAWEFAHPQFRRGRPDLLETIRRRTLDSETIRCEATRDLRADMNDQYSQIQAQVSAMNEALTTAQSENMALWEFVNQLRESIALVVNHSHVSDAAAPTALPLAPPLPQPSIGSHYGLPLCNVNSLPRYPFHPSS